MENFEAVKKFISKHKINQLLISQNVGIKPTTFSTKMKEHGYHKFSEKQKQLIVEYLENLGAEIINFTKELK